MCIGSLVVQSMLVRSRIFVNVNEVESPNIFVFVPNLLKLYQSTGFGGLLLCKYKLNYPFKIIKQNGRSNAVPCAV